MLTGEMADLTETKRQNDMRGLFCREVRHVVNFNSVNNFMSNFTVNSILSDYCDAAVAPVVSK